MVGISTLRATMVEQVRRHAGSPVSDAVAGALGLVPRHLFLPHVPAEAAYHDDAIATKLNAHGLPISSSSQPTVMALMLDQLDLAPGHRVLEIGAGTGYNAALMWQLVSPGGTVVSMDIDQDLVDTAHANLARAGYPEVKLVRADGAEGFIANAPYDRIIATVGVWDLAPAWLDQLAPDGRLVVPLDLEGVQRSVAFTRQNGHWVSQSTVPCGFMRLRGALAGPERTHVLDSETILSVMVPDGGTVDRLVLLAAWDQRPARIPTRVTATVKDVFGGLGLWLATSGLRWCTVSEHSSASRPRLVAAPLEFKDQRLTAGIFDRDGIAVFALEPGPEATADLVALGYGRDGQRLAAELAELVYAWDAAGQPGSDGLRIDAYPKSTPDSELAGKLVIEKRYTRIAVSWPA